MSRTINIIFGLLAIVFCIHVSYAQNAPQYKESLTLKETLELANKKSLDAFKAKRQYAISYWQYRSFKARLLPKVDLLLEPFTYIRSFVERYDPDNNVDVYRLQQNVNTYAQVSASQNIMATGTRIFLNSSFNRLQNFGVLDIENYSATPVRIGLVQPIMAYNELKWLDKTAELEFEKAKQEFIYQEQEINLKVISLFFDWALATTEVEIAEENKENAERLYEIGKKRYGLGSIQRDDLLNLELESFTSTTALTQARQRLQAVVSDLQIFLNEDNLSLYTPELPELISKLKIDLQDAIRYLEEYNPDLLDIEIRKIYAARDLDKAIKENRFDLSINASYGLNQQANTFDEVYGSFLDQQLIAIRFSIPLLDWGERKGNIKTARMTKELNDIEIEQTGNDINRTLNLKVNNFNLQEDLVAASLRAKEISRESYDITENRFLRGNVDLLRLLNSRSAWQTASEAYINSLQEYWTYYYEVQQLTLYDFENKITLSEDFERVLEE